MNLLFFLIFGIPILIVVIAILYWRDKQIEEGKAAYFVKIAASGKGGVYHSPSCGKCRSNVLITENQAQNQGYAPCSVCGGNGEFRKIEH